MTLREFFDGYSSENFDYSNPDYRNMGSWPAAIKVTVLLLLSVLIVVVFYFLQVRHSQDRLQVVSLEEPDLKEIYKIKALQVANLEALKNQLAQMEKDFGALVNQLPNELKLPDLLEELNTTGAQSGLEIDKITPKREREQDVYYETPITMSVRGSYHEMGNFVSSLVSIGTIVTLHDFKIRKINQSRDSIESIDPLEMVIEAKTYRYKGAE